jgi:hypothetical protein
MSILLFWNWLDLVWMEMEEIEIEMKQEFSILFILFAICAYRKA